MTRATGLVGLVELACAAALGCSTNCVLDDDLRLFAGDDAIDCGTADVKHTRSTIDQCAVDAFDARKSFMARYQQQGTDSNLVTAVAMNSAGVVKVFRWDSSPSGGSGAAVTDEQTCEGPTLSKQTSADANALPIDCTTLDLAQRTCG